MPWQVGDKFEILRIEEADITPAAFDMKESTTIPEFGWKRRTVFHTTATGTKENLLLLELVIASQHVDGRWGKQLTSATYERGKGLRNGLTGELEEVPKELQRLYKCGVDPRGIMRDWEDRLDAMACLHGLGGEYYNVFTSALLELPSEVVPWGHSWQTASAVNLAHCDQVPFKLACVLRQGASNTREEGYCVAAEAFLPDSSPPHLGKRGMRVGSGTWWISPDKKRIEGTFALNLVNEGKSTLRWRDEVVVRPIDYQR